MQLPWSSGVALLWLKGSTPPCEAGPSRQLTGEFWSLWAAREKDPSPWSS